MACRLGYPSPSRQQWPSRPSLDSGWLTVVGRVDAALTITDVEPHLTVGGTDRPLAAHHVRQRRAARPRSRIPSG